MSSHHPGPKLNQKEMFWAPLWPAVVLTLLLAITAMAFVIPVTMTLVNIPSVPK